MKVKPKTKKILVLSIMVVLLVTTGVLNFVLSDKLSSKNDAPTLGDVGTVTQTFFAAARSDREATRESEFLSLDAIVNSETTSASAKQTAEQQKPPPMFGKAVPIHAEGFFVVILIETALCAIEQPRKAQRYED